MNEYKRAKDVKIDDIIFRSYGGEIREIKVSSIRKFKPYSNTIFEVNGNIYFKEKSTKGLNISHSKDWDISNELDSLEFRIEQTVYFTDKRVATTHAVGYWNKIIEEKQDVINKACESMKVISLNIAKLRFDEFEQPKTEE